jgi:hypothetical protein
MAVDLGSLSKSLAGLSLSSAGTGSSVRAAAAPGSQRHNVGRVPELDYFARKLASDSKGNEGSHWRGLPYGKAGQAGALPDVHASPEAYLTAMQAHTALEFQVGMPCCR